MYTNKYYRKWAPKFEQVQKYLKDMENFRNEIFEISTNHKILIDINKKCNSIYFKWDDQYYRISTHKKPYECDHRINIITNSRANILKHLKRILGVTNEQI